MAKERGALGSGFDQMTAGEMRDRVKWDCRRAVAGADVEQSSFGFELKTNPHRLNNQTAYQIRTRKSGQINLGTPPREFAAVGDESFFLELVEFNLKILELGF